MKNKDIYSFLLGGGLFAALTIVLTILAVLKSEHLFEYAIGFLVAILLLLIVIALFWVVHKNKIANQLTGSDSKDLKEILDDSATFLDGSSEEEVTPEIRYARRQSIKNLFYWFMNTRAKILMAQTAFGVVGLIALFLSTIVLVDQNKKIEAQIEVQKESYTNSRVTELMQLLYTDNIVPELKTVAWSELMEIENLNNDRSFEFRQLELDGIIFPKLNYSNRGLEFARFNNFALDQFNFSNSYLSNSVFNNGEIFEAKFINSEFSYSTFIDSWLIWSNFKSEDKGQTHVNNTSFLNTRFRGSDFDKASIFESFFVDSDLSSSGDYGVLANECPDTSHEDMIMPITDVEDRFRDLPFETKLTGVIIANTKFLFSTIDRSDFSNSKIWNSEFVCVTGRRVDFTNIEASPSIFIYSDMRGSDFSRGKNLNAKFVYSDLRNTKWNFSELTKLDFTGSDLRCSDFSNIRFTGNYDQKVNLSGADMTSVIGFDDLVGHACWDQKTKFPKGFSKPIKKCTNREFISPNDDNKIRYDDLYHNEMSQEEKQLFREKFDSTMELDLTNQKIPCYGTHEVIMQR